MKIDINAIKSKLSKEDLEKIKTVAGKDKDLIMKKIDELS